MSDDIIISARNLTKTYRAYAHPLDRFIPSRAKRCKEFHALNDVSFDIKRGETVGIIGRNGSGKSTLLQLICGIRKPTSGSLQVNGRISALLELGAGFHPEFTGRENVFLQGAIQGMSRQEMEARFDDIAAFADIGEYIDQPVKTYSSGMFVRLAFAVAVSVEPDILVVDEALGVGDEAFQRKCFTRLESLKSQGTSILFVSHSGSQIVALCDKALLLEHGSRLVYASPPQAVRAYQELIYAPHYMQKRLIKKYLSIDQSGGDMEIAFDDSECPPAVEHEDFDPKLIPESTIVYPVQGAVIEKFEILDNQDRKVNVLNPRQEYRFVIAGKFLSDIDDVFIGVHISSITGMVIAGQRHPEEGKYLASIRAGENFRAIFQFAMRLLPGTYFVGGGVWSNQEPNCLHRVLDSLMFRVAPAGKSISFGYVDISLNEPIIEIL